MDFLQVVDVVPCLNPGAGWAIESVMFDAGSVRGILKATLLSSLLGGCAAQADVKPVDPGTLPTPDRNLDMASQAYLKRFDNGLTLFVVPDRYTKLVQFDVRQKVGARDDPKGKSGMAHFVEHLMFNIPAGGEGSPKIMLDLPQHSLSFNAYTSPDETHYMHTGPVEELETYVKYTAARLSGDCSAIDDSAFLRERDVVRNEHRWRSEGVDIYVRDEVIARIFPEGHPYRAKTNGEDLELASITQDDACGFIQRYYTAGQANVVVTGAVDPQEVLRLAEKYLVPLPKVDAPPRAAVPPVDLGGKKVEIVAPVEKPTAMIVFPMPHRFSPDYAPFIAAQETMFMAISFFARRGPIKNWYPVQLGGKEVPLMGIAVETKKPGQLDRAVRDVLGSIARGFSRDLNDPDERAIYDSVRQRTRYQILAGIGTLSNSSNAYADYLDEPQPGFFGKELLAVDNLTSQFVQEKGRAFFDAGQAMVVKVVPEKGETRPKVARANFDYKPDEGAHLSIPANIDPATAHEPLLVADIEPAETESVEFEMENGMKVILVKSSGVPIMEVQVIVAGGEADTAGLPILATMAGQFYGAPPHKEAIELSTAFRLAGGMGGTRVGVEATTFQTQGLAMYLDFLMAFTSEQVVQAVYRDGSIERWKQSRKDSLKKQSRRQRIDRENAFNRALYGEGHPYVRAQITDPKRLRDITLRDVEAFRDTHYRAANSAIVVTGGFDLDLATQYVKAYFGAPKLRERGLTWQQPRVGQTSATPPEPRPGDVRVMTQADDERSQTDIRIAYPLQAVYGERHAALQVLAEMLNFRVSTVRQTLGSSYGVYARLNTGRPQIRVSGAVDSAEAGQAYKAILAEVQRLRDGEDFDREFAFARRTVFQNMVNNQGDSESFATQLAAAIRAGQSYDYFQALATSIATLKPAQVKAEIDRVLRDDRSVTLIQGPAAGVENVVKVGGIQGAKQLPDVVHDDDE